MKKYWWIGGIVVLATIGFFIVLSGRASYAVFPVDAEHVCINLDASIIFPGKLSFQTYLPIADYFVDTNGVSVNSRDKQETFYFEQFNVGSTIKKTFPDSLPVFTVNTAGWQVYRGASAGPMPTVRYSVDAPKQFSLVANPENFSEAKIMRTIKTLRPVTSCPESILAAEQIPTY